MREGGEGVKEDSSSFIHIRLELFVSEREDQFAGAIIFLVQNLH